MSTENASRESSGTRFPLTDTERIALREIVAFLDEGVRDMVRFAKTADYVDVQVPRLRALAKIMRALEDDVLLVDDDVLAVVIDDNEQIVSMMEEHQDSLRRLARREDGILYPGDDDFEGAEASTREELDGLLDEYAGTTSILQRAGVA
jgi:hypothetical protein